MLRRRFVKEVLVALASCGAALLAACTHSSGDPPGGVATDRAQVEAALRQYSDLVLKLDHVGIASLFAPEGEILNSGQPPIHGPAAIERFLGGFAGYHVLANSTEPSSTVVMGDRAVQQGSYRQRVRTPEGQVLEVAGTFKAEWIRGGAGRWLILRMSTSPAR